MRKLTIKEVEEKIPKFGIMINRVNTIDVYEEYQKLLREDQLKEQENEIKYLIEMDPKKFENEVLLDNEKVENKKAKKYVSDIFAYCLRSKKFFKIEYLII